MHLQTNFIPFLTKKNSKTKTTHRVSHPKRPQNRTVKLPSIIEANLHPS